MGLDVVGFEKAVLVEPHEHTASNSDDWQDQCYEAGHIKAWLQTPDFIRSLRGLQVDKVYAVSGDTADYSAGYGSHSWIRKEIASVLSLDLEDMWERPTRHENDPFFEVLNFSDCEGVIGPEACADLAADFDEHWNALSAHFLTLPRTDWIQRLTNLRECFVVAAGTGLVRFS